ncbi:uncharacterized protein [Arachis hypogaea]|uniref:uncharacterized protein isoform X2 n=1 Tax=Arachis hypogaea TaxID=3818 RepID=UPI003B20F0C5
MNDGRQMGLHYMDNGFPYAVNDSNFVDFFQGVSHVPVNYTFAGSMPDQECVYWSMNMNQYKFGLSGPGSTSYYGSYEVNDHLPRMEINRAEWEYPSVTITEEPATADSPPIREGVTSMQTIPEECSPNHHESDGSQITSSHTFTVMESCDKMNGGTADIVSGGGNKKGSDNGICCNCQKSQCLKLYCECLRAGNLCNNSCTCKACENNENNRDKVYEKKKEIELRDPEAFQSKIIIGGNEAARHRKGCNCRKSKCKNKHCACFSAGVGCSNQCKCDDCMNEYGIVNNQQVLVLTNDSNNNGSNNITVDNGSSQFQHLFADNDGFLQNSESDMDRIFNEIEQADYYYYGQQTSLSSNSENGINNNNVNLPSNQQDSHVLAAAVCYNYNLYGNIIQNNVAAPNYHQHLTTPRQISPVEYNNTIDDLDLEGPSSSWFYGEPSSLPSFFTTDTAIQDSNQQYKPETLNYGDIFQQEALPISPTMNQSAQHLTNTQPPSHPNNNQLP